MCVIIIIIISCGVILTQESQLVQSQAGYQTSVFSSKHFILSGSLNAQGMSVPVWWGPLLDKSRLVCRSSRSVTYWSPTLTQSCPSVIKNQNGINENKLNLSLLAVVETTVVKICDAPHQNQAVSADSERHVQVKNTHNSVTVSKIRFCQIVIPRVFNYMYLSTF